MTTTPDGRDDARRRDDVLHGLGQPHSPEPDTRDDAGAAGSGSEPGADARAATPEPGSDAGGGTPSEPGADASGATTSEPGPGSSVSRAIGGPEAGPSVGHATGSSEAGSAGGSGLGRDARISLDGGVIGAAEPVTGETSDEALLRELMHGAVRGIHGSPNALDHLRRAVPARRQHRRQALAGSAAALLLAGAAVPALIHAAGTVGSPAAAPVGATTPHAGAPGEDGHTGKWATGGVAGQSSPRPNGLAPGEPNRSTGPGVGPSSLPSASGGGTLQADIPVCAGSQLGHGASQAGSPDAGGRIYGWFRVANVSTEACTVPDPGQVRAVAIGSADPARIQVVGHTAGDPASGLPDTSAIGPVVLAPGDDYEVAFAWVPADTGPGGCAAPSTPPPSTPTPSATTTEPANPDPGTASDPGGVSPQLVGEPTADPAPAGVALNHTPAAGSPVVDGPVLKDVCAGTVYTTTAMPAPASDTATP